MSASRFALAAAMALHSTGCAAPDESFDTLDPCAPSRQSAQILEDLNRQRDDLHSQLINLCQPDAHDFAARTACYVTYWSQLTNLYSSENCQIAQLIDLDPQASDMPALQKSLSCSGAFTDADNDGFSDLVEVLMEKNPCDPFSQVNQSCGGDASLSVNCTIPISQVCDPERLDLPWGGYAAPGPMMACD